MADYSQVQALTFDLFGTVLDLGGSLTPYIGEFLLAQGSPVTPDLFWEQWRYRQRLEQYQDTIMMLGHSGYLETVRRAFVYTLARNQIQATPQQVADFMQAWQFLSPFQDVAAALRRLQERYKLVVLSNGDPDFLVHLAQNRVQWDFDQIISVTQLGAFKPHPSVYRGAARILGLELAHCLMVSANSFDVVGARACGFQAVYVNRYSLPYEETPYRPTATVRDFTALADELLAS